MTLTHKILVALITALLSPAIITFVASGHWSQDLVDISAHAVIFLVPLLLIALVIRAFHARKVAEVIYIVGMGTFLLFAIMTLGGELHAPVFGQAYIPTILLTFPFGLMAIRHRSDEKKNA